MNKFMCRIFCIIVSSVPRDTEFWKQSKSLTWQFWQWFYLVLRTLLCYLNAWQMFIAVPKVECFVYATVSVDASNFKKISETASRKYWKYFKSYLWFQQFSGILIFVFKSWRLMSVGNWKVFHATSCSKNCLFHTCNVIGIETEI